MGVDPKSVERFIELARERGHSEEHIHAFLERSGYRSPPRPPRTREPAHTRRMLIIALVVFILIACASALIVAFQHAPTPPPTASDNGSNATNHTSTPSPKPTTNETAPPPVNETMPEPTTDAPTNSSTNTTEPTTPVAFGDGSSGGVSNDSAPITENGTTEPPPPPPPAWMETYAENTSAIENPERGFFESITLSPTGDYSYVRGNNNTLVRAYVELNNYTSSSIPQSFLDDLNASFERIREAGVKLVLRVAYEETGNGSDAPLTYVLMHIGQLEPVFDANRDAIAVFEAGYIGYWGEWHDSTNGLDSNANRDTIMSAILNGTPTDRMVEFRDPADLERNYPVPLNASQAFSGTNQARAGHHNDCFLGSSDDVGTYDNPNYTQAELKDYLQAIGPYTATGGETCNARPLNQQRSDCSTALDELDRFGFTDLNLFYAQDVISRWKSEGCFDEIRNRLGYRYVLDGANLTESVAQGNNLTLVVNVENTGFGSLYNPRPLMLVLIDGSGHRLNLTLAADARTVLPLSGENVTRSFSVEVPNASYPGTYRAALWLPDNATTLRSDPRYSIRLANDGTWNASYGTNELGLNVTIAGTPPPLSPGSGLRGSYFDSTNGTRMLTRLDASVNFSWGTGAPASNLSNDYFSAVWNGSIAAPSDGEYVLSVRSDDGYRLYVNGTLVASNWTNLTSPGAETIEDSSAVHLAPWVAVPITLEYYEANGSALVELSWRNATDAPSERRLIPVRFLYPADRAADLPPSGAPKASNGTGPVVVLGPRVVASGNLSDGTRFASPNGTGTACTQVSPCSATTAMTGAAPGDHVFLKGGTYPLTGTQVSLSYSATNTSPIIIESYPGERAVLDGQLTVNRLVIWGNSYTLRNIDVTRMNQSGVFIGGSNNTVEGVNAYGNLESGFGVFSPYSEYPYGAHGSYNTISDCRSYNNSDVSKPANGGNADGISVSSGEGNVITHCFVANNSDDGIDAWRSTHTLISFSISLTNGRASGDGNGIKAGGQPPSNGTIVMHTISAGNQAIGFDQNSGHNISFLYDTGYDNNRSFWTGPADRIIGSIAAGTGSNESLFGGGVMTNDSWQMNGTVSFLSTDVNSTDYLRPTPNGGFTDIGAYAASPYLNETSAPFT